MSKTIQVRREFFSERVNALRFSKWQIPMKSDPKIKGLTLMYFYTEEAVEEFIMRLELAAGLTESIEALPTPSEPKTKDNG